MCLLYRQFQHDKLWIFNYSVYKIENETYPIVLLLVFIKEIPSRGYELNSAAITLDPGKANLDKMTKSRGNFC